MNIKDIILKFINKPVNNVRSSQTLYEVMFTLLNMNEIYKEQRYRKQIKELSELMLKTQMPDGGFDIGYNFAFGINMTKKSEKESTTPEVLSIYALIKYYDLYKDDAVINSIEKGINWILNNSYKYLDKYWVIPYAPSSYKEIHITNAISFAVSTLTYYMYVFKENINPRIQEICDGMLSYMRDELIVDNNKGYWNYFEKKLIKENDYYIKIDNYHIAQQLYYHMQIQNYYKNNDNDEIVKLVSNYLKDKVKENVAVPYIETKEKKTRDIHTWGYASILLCALEWKNTEYIDNIATFMKNNIIGNNHFYPIVKESGEVIDENYYPRSDAWVLHSFSEYLLYNKSDNKIKKIIDIGLQLQERSKYSGKENHVYTFRKKYFSKCINMIKKFRRRK